MMTFVEMSKLIGNRSSGHGGSMNFRWPFRNHILIGFLGGFIILGLVSHTASHAALTGSAEVETRAESILQQMTLEEKIDMLGGVDGFFIRGFPRLGLPRLKMADGPVGVRNDGPATAMAAGIALAGTWESG